MRTLSWLRTFLVLLGVWSACTTERPDVTNAADVRDCAVRAECAMGDRTIAACLEQVGCGPYGCKLADWFAENDLMATVEATQSDADIHDCGLVSSDATWDSKVSYRLIDEEGTQWMLHVALWEHAPEINVGTDLRIRVTDANGNWSLVPRHNFHVLDPDGWLFSIVSGSPDDGGLDRAAPKDITIARAAACRTDCEVAYDLKVESPDESISLSGGETGHLGGFLWLYDGRAIDRLWDPGPEAYDFEAVLDPTIAYVRDDSAQQRYETDEIWDGTLRQDQPPPLAPYSAPRSLPRFVLRDAERRGAVCNDGSPATFYYASYYRLPNPETVGRWIITLEGRGTCATADQCTARAAGQPEAMTSTMSPEATALNGLYADIDSNPDFYDWKRVYIPDCSSDAWLGDRGASPETGGLHFRGARIFQAVMEDLGSADFAGKDPLGNAREVILSGFGTGGLGAVQHADELAEMLPSARVKGLVDSALTDYPTAPDAKRAGALSAQVAYWGAALDASCMDATDGDVATCADPVKVLDHVSTPLFVLTDQHDPSLPNAELWGGAAPPEEVAARIRELVGTRASGGYSPRGGVHGWSTKSLFYTYPIDGWCAMRVFANWYFDRDGPKVLVQAEDPPKVDLLLGELEACEGRAESDTCMFMGKIGKEGGICIYDTSARLSCVTVR